MGKKYSGRQGELSPVDSLNIPRDGEVRKAPEGERRSGGGKENTSELGPRLGDPEPGSG